MGRMRVEDNNTTATLSEALVLTTMCIVGLPVHVHIIDGSIFSGIFHSASSLDHGYGIVLKKARMIKKGTCNTNANGGLMDTLVIHPRDLVQVVAKGVMLPSEHGSATCNGDGGVSGNIGFLHGAEKGAPKTAEQTNRERFVYAVRQVGVCRSLKQDGCYHSPEALIEVVEDNHSTTTLNGNYPKPSVLKEDQATATQSGLLAANDAALNANLVKQFQDKEIVSTKSVTLEVSDLHKTESDAPRSPVSVAARISSQNPLMNKIAKESKLNPSAKVFSPSLANIRSTPTPVPTVPTVAYVSNSIPSVQVAAPQPEVGIRAVAPCTSWPVKFVPYVTSAPVTVDHGLQHIQHIAGHMETRTQPLRYGAQYQPLQSMPPYLHANPQNGMFGRPGQLVYVHPVTHDVIHAPATLSPSPHPLFSSHHIDVPKHEGVLAGQGIPVSVTPPLMSNVSQPFMMPNHVQLSPPLFLPVRPVPVLGSNIPYSAKFS